jgi:outer membrane protein assembly factor BamD (BamD/ComL family)
VPEARQRWRESRDRLSEHNFRVGQLYYRMQVYAGALSRFQEVLKEDPGFTGRDQVYYYLAELYLRADKPAEAIPYYARLVKEFVESEYLDRARQRLQELEPKTPQ